MNNRRNQPRIKGMRRMPVSSAFQENLERAVRKEMMRFKVSRSFVVAVATANELGVKLDYDYKT